MIILFALACERHKDISGRTVFKYNESAGITSLDPAFARDQAVIWADNQLFNGLVQLDDQLIVRPCIAKSWDISDEGKTYTFHLRQDVHFQKNQQIQFATGRKVLASDFVFSFNRLLQSDIASPGAWIFQYVAKDSISNKFAFFAINDSTFQIQLSSTYPPFLSLLSMQYCSVVPSEVVNFYGKDFRTHPVGTGPFMLKLWKEGVKLVLVKNPDYFEFENGKRLPNLDAVSISFIIDKQSAFLEFVKGNLDFISGIDASYKDELLSRNGKLRTKYAKLFNLITCPYLNTEYLGFQLDEKLANSQANPLKNKLIRRAINYGFDRAKMIHYLRNNIGYAGLYGMIPLGLQGFDTTQSIAYNYNPNLSADLLKEAGYPGGKNLPTISLHATSSYLDLCQYIQQQLGELGFNIKIEVNPPATLRNLIANQKVPFFRGSWIADYPDAENYLSLFYSKNFSPKGPNYTHFKNEAFDVLYEKAMKELNDSVRIRYYKRMNEILIEEAPVVVLYYDQVIRLVQNNIKNLGINSLNLLNLKRVIKTGE